jgi:hypothetical protein
VRILLTLAALVCLTATAEAGPIRDRIRDARPGLIVPKRTAPACASCAGCQLAPTYAPAPQVVQASYASAYAAPQYLPAYPFPQPGCANGRCPTK